MKKNRKNKKSKLISIIIILILILIIYAICKIVTTKKLKVELKNNMSIILTYSSLKYKQEKNEKNENILKRNGTQIVIKDIESLENYSSDYSILKDYRKMAYKGEEISLNGKDYLLYRRKDGEYELVTQLDKNYYLEIQIIRENEENKEAKDVISEKNLNKVLNSINIK